MATRFSEEVEAILSKPTATVEEFKTVMGCGRGAAYEWVREGRIRSLTMGRRILIPTSDIRTILGVEEEIQAGENNAAAAL